MQTLKFNKLDHPIEQWVIREKSVGKKVGVSIDEWLAMLWYIIEVIIQLSFSLQCTPFTLPVRIICSIYT